MAVYAPVSADGLRPEKVASLVVPNPPGAGSAPSISSVSIDGLVYAVEGGGGDLNARVVDELPQDLEDDMYYFVGGGGAEPPPPGPSVGYYLKSETSSAQELDAAFAACAAPAPSARPVFSMAASGEPGSMARRTDGGIRVMINSDLATGALSACTYVVKFHTWRWDDDHRADGDYAAATIGAFAAAGANISIDVYQTDGAPLETRTARFSDFGGMWQPLRTCKIQQPSDGTCTGYVHFLIHVKGMSGTYNQFALGLRMVDKPADGHENSFVSVSVFDGLLPAGGAMVYHWDRSMQRQEGDQYYADESAKTLPNWNPSNDMG